MDLYLFVAAVCVKIVFLIGSYQRFFETIIINFYLRFSMSRKYVTQKHLIYGPVAMSWYLF